MTPARNGGFALRPVGFGRCCMPLLDVDGDDVGINRFAVRQMRVIARPQLQCVFSANQVDRGLRLAGATCR